ncbi:unnamed protein product [Phyllotreta striolata]|uniref:Uncharacterized protein n=1 Tax=Phyllotreta striolata TaxID=444603 RepID=A0A9N9TIJ5_PHYSR|nr:unnamed protein product [Phyllotreta striolata]
MKVRVAPPVLPIPLSSLWPCGRRAATGSRLSSAISAARLLAWSLLPGALRASSLVGWAFRPRSSGLFLLFRRRVRRRGSVYACFGRRARFRVYCACSCRRRR